MAGEKNKRKPETPVGSTGLVARLRLHRSARELEWVRRTLMDEAANRIEELERGLRTIRTWANCGAGDPEAELEDIVDKADKLLSATVEVCHEAQT